MPTYDPIEQKLCLRVVYDGVASAGKTTNVRQFANLVVAQRTTEVLSPAELRGRTLYFDWMQVSAGSICGLPLVCQIISVPGQDALADRRRHLLSLADVVVFVADSERSSVEGTRACLLSAVASLRRRDDSPRSLVVQANKQDRPEALSGAELVAALGHEGAEVIEAIATDGIGVVDTFMAAVRSAARAIRARAEEGELRIAVRRTETEHELLAELAAFEIDPCGAAELFLEQAAAAYEAEMDLAPAARAARTLALGSSASAPAKTNSRIASSSRSAPLPTADVPVGFVWPAHVGRGVLRSLALIGDVEVDAAGASRTYDDRVFSTSLDECFVDAEVARQALVRSARERTQLGPLLVDDTVLVVQPAVTGEAWLWTVTPPTEPVLGWLSRSPARVEALGAAVANAALVILEHGFGLRPHVDDFRVQAGSVRYGGPTRRLDANAEDRPPRALDFLIRVVSEMRDIDVSLDTFVGAVARGLHARLGHRELAKLVDTLRPVSSGPPETTRLVDALVRLAEVA